MIKLSLVTASVVVVALAAPAQAQQQQQQQQQQQAEAPAETVRETHGAWEVICLTEQPEQCRMRQVGTIADGKRAMVVHIGKLKDYKGPDGKLIPAAIRITTPLGTLLREGLKLKIDSGKEQTGIFNVCIPSGCIVSEPLSDQFLQQLKGGNVAKMSFSVLQQGPLSVDISLKGFTKAYNAL